MVQGFLKSEEGIREYKKIGLSYPDHLQDELYEDWMKQTQGYSEDVAHYYGPYKEKEVHAITRVKTKEGKEYLTYQMMHRRLDEAANLTHRYLSPIGEYPIPIPHYAFKQMNFGKMERTVDEVVSIEKAYSIPFSKKNLDKIREIGLQHEGKVQYSLQLPNSLISFVKSYEDLRDGIFEELAHFTRIPTDTQRQRWLREGGPSADMQMQEDFLRQRIEGDIPQRPVTEDDVRKMIKQEQKREEEPTDTVVNTTTAAPAAAVDTSSSNTTPTKKKSKK